MCIFCLHPRGETGPRNRTRPMTELHATGLRPETALQAGISAGTSSSALQPPQVFLAPSPGPLLLPPSPTTDCALSAVSAYTELRAKNERGRCTASLSGQQQAGGPCTLSSGGRWGQEGRQSRKTGGGEAGIRQGTQSHQVNRENNSSGTYGQGQHGSKVAEVPVLGTQAAG